jgi:hypothetical protein
MMFSALLKLAEVRRKLAVVTGKLLVDCALAYVAAF